MWEEHTGGAKEERRCIFCMSALNYLVQEEPTASSPSLSFPGYPSLLLPDTVPVPPGLPLLLSRCCHVSLPPG